MSREFSLKLHVCVLNNSGDIPTSLHSFAGVYCCTMRDHASSSELISQMWFPQGKEPKRAGRTFTCVLQRD